jgi:hypothetical protein
VPTATLTSKMFQFLAALFNEGCRKCTSSFGLKLLNCEQDTINNANTYCSSVAYCEFVCSVAYCRRRIASRRSEGTLCLLLQETRRLVYSASRRSRPGWLKPQISMSETSQDKYRSFQACLYIPAWIYRRKSASTSTSVDRHSNSVHTVFSSIQGRCTPLVNRFSSVSHPCNNKQWLPWFHLV